MASDPSEPEQREPDILTQPAAQRQERLLTLAIRGAERRGDVAAAQLAQQVHCARKQQRLTLYVVRIHARYQALQQRPPPGGGQVLREVQLARRALTDRHVGVTDEVRR